MKKNKRKKTGMPPGSSIFVGEQKVAFTNITLLQYSETSIEEKNWNEAFPTLLETSEAYQLWYDVKGVHDAAHIESFGKKFNIHPLVIEDIMNTKHRPKFEEFDSGFCIIIPAYRLEEPTLRFVKEQISIYVGKGFLLSFQEDSEELFDTIRLYMKTRKGRICNRRSDFLAYSLLDHIVDKYLDALDVIEEKIEQLEREVTSNPTSRVKSTIYHLKGELNSFKKNTFTLREAVYRWIRSESDFTAKGTHIFLNDLLDHINVALERAEDYREMLTELQGLYIAEMSAKTNGVINVLTIISSIFIPLTFIAGVYGMNFKYMPELEWEYGYYYTWGFMVIAAVAMLLYFRHRRWL